MVGDSSSHSSGVNGLTQIVNPLLSVEHSSSAAVVEVVAGTQIVTPLSVKHSSSAAVVEVVAGTQIVTPLSVKHSSSAAVVEVVAGTVVVGAVVVGTVVVGTVVVGTVVGAVVVGTVVVGTVVVGTVVGAVVVGTVVVGTVVGAVVVGTVVVGTVVGAVVVGTVVVGTVVGAVVVGTVVVGTVVGAVVVGTVVEVVAVVVGEVEVGTVVVGDSSSHSSGVNGLTQIVNPSSSVKHSSSAAAATANMTSPAAIRKRNADPRLRATNSFGNVHCQDSCGRTETVPTIGSGLYRARTDLATLYALSSGSATATWSRLRSLRTSHVRPAFDELSAGWVAVVGRASVH